MTPDVTAASCDIHNCTVPPPPSSDRTFDEPYFKMIGASRIGSLDFWTFEGATVQHDFNQSLPAVLRAKYDLVLNGGTLKDVLNFPQALKSCMELIRPSDHFVQVNNANNFMRHGFWQISLDADLSLDERRQWYEVLAVMDRELHDNGRTAGKIHIARDPDALGWRVELSNRHPTYIIIIARRTVDGIRGRSDLPGIKATAIAAGCDIIPNHIEHVLRSPPANKAYFELSTPDVVLGRFGKF